MYPQELSPQPQPDIYIWPIHILDCTFKFQSNRLCAQQAETRNPKRVTNSNLSDTPTTKATWPDKSIAHVELKRRTGALSAPRLSQPHNPNFPAIIVRRLGRPVRHSTGPSQRNRPGRHHPGLAGWPARARARRPAAVQRSPGGTAGGRVSRWLSCQ
jgi:hypothetical protein